MPDWANQAAEAGLSENWGKLAEVFPDYGHERIQTFQLAQILTPAKATADTFVTDSAIYVAVGRASGGYDRAVAAALGFGPWRYGFSDISNIEIDEKRGAVWFEAACTDRPQTEWLRFRSGRAPGWNWMLKDDFKHFTSSIWDQWKAVTEESGGGEGPPSGASLVLELERAADLHRQDLLTDEEFEAVKRRLLQRE